MFGTNVDNCGLQEQQQHFLWDTYVRTALCQRHLQ